MNTNIRNLDKIDKFLDKYKLLKLKLKEIENLSYSIKEIEFFLKKNLLTKKLQAQMVSLLNCINTERRHNIHTT